VKKKPQTERKDMLRYYHGIFVGLIDVRDPSLLTRMCRIRCVGLFFDSYVPDQAAMRHELRSTNILTGLTLQLTWLSNGFATLVLGDRRPQGRFT